MENSETIKFNWNNETNTGTSFLYLKMAILTKYALPPLIYGYSDEVGIFISSYQTLKAYQSAQNEIDKYIVLLRMYGLSQESEFHSSHIAYLLIDFMIIKDANVDSENIKRRLHNRLYLLHNLINVEDFRNYDVNIIGKVTDFKYGFKNDYYLKRNMIRYLIGEVKAQVKSYDSKLYNLILKGLNEDELTQAVEKSTYYEVEKLLTAELAKRILRYLNTETVVLANDNQIEHLSVTNDQGDFIYDVLTLFKIYRPQKRSKSDIVKHHDTIRKLIKRSEIIDEDN